MSYPYPPMGPGQQPPGGQPWGAPPPQGGYGTPPQGGYGTPPQGGYGTPPQGGYGTPPPGGYPPPPMQGWQGPEQVPGGPPPMYPPPMGPPPKKSSAGVIALVIVGALVLVGASLGGAYYLAAGGGDDGAARSTPSAAASSSTGGAPASGGGQNKPANYHAMKSWSLWDSLNTASQDSRPMTLEEVFADAEAKAYKDTSDGTTFNIQGSGRLDTDCGGTVSTPVLKTTLQGYGCTQVIRAAYVSDDQHWVGQLAIFNLRDVTSANAFLDDLDPKSGKGFFLPVTGASPVEKFGSSATGAESGAYGHFVVVGWAGRVDGVQGDRYGIDTISPSSAVQQAGKQFLFHRN